jgi:hypothetical protein
MGTGFQRVLSNEDLYSTDDNMTSKVLLEHLGLCSLDWPLPQGHITT